MACQKLALFFPLPFPWRDYQLHLSPNFRLSLLPRSRGSWGSSAPEAGEFQTQASEPGPHVCAVRVPQAAEEAGSPLEAGLVQAPNKTKPQLREPGGGKGPRLALNSGRQLKSALSHTTVSAVMCFFLPLGVVGSCISTLQKRLG